MREARVADPGEAVVPVALAADRLGQRGGGGGDDRAGRPVGEPLEHARADAARAPGAGPRRCRARPPRSARPRRCRRSARPPRRARSARAALAASAGAQRSEKPTCSPSATREGRAHRRVLDLERHAGAHARCGSGRRTCARRRPRARTSGATRPYSGRGASSSVELDRCPRRPRRSAAARAARRSRGRGRAGPSAKAIASMQPDRARVGGEGRLDHERAGQVAALGRERSASGGSTSGPASGSRMRAKTAALS